MSPAPPNNNWKWFFAIVFALALFTAVSLIWWNLRLQLKPEQLEANRRLWEANGPADYVMVYMTRRNEETSTDRYVVKVKQKKAYEVLVNGIPEPPERLEYQSMDSLFNYIERFLELDSEPGKPRTYARASFDEKTGAIRNYVRRVMGKTERLEINVEPLATK